LIRLEQEKTGNELMSSAALPFIDLNDGVLEDSLVPHNIDKVLQKLEESGVGEEGLQDEDVSTSGFDEPGDSLPEEHELDLSAGELDKTADPVRLYMRENGHGAVTYSRAGSGNRQTN